MSKTTNQPLYRVKFCSIVGTDENGRDKLGKAIEIGTVWPRKDARKGAILKLDIVPQNFSSGVSFLDPVTSGDRGYV